MPKSVSRMICPANCPGFRTVGHFGGVPAGKPTGLWTKIWKKRFLMVNQLFPWPFSTGLCEFTLPAARRRGPRNLEAYNAWVEANGAEGPLELDTSQGDHLADAMWRGEIAGKSRGETVKLMGSMGKDWKVMRKWWANDGKDGKDGQINRKTICRSSRIHLSGYQ